MKATILGYKGFIGRNLVSRLNNLGWQCQSPNQLEEISFNSNLGHVFYCAGLTADYIERPFDTVEAHVCLLSKILKHGEFESLVYLSSTRLYDGLNSKYAEESINLNLNPNNPRHLYDLSKSLGESLALVSGSGKARIARLSCVYKDHKDLDGFLPNLIDLVIKNYVLKNKDVLLDTSINYFRDYVWIDDVVEALILIATKGTQPIYNVASGENVLNSKIFDTIKGITGIHIQTSSNQELPNSPIISIDRMSQEFNWKPVSVLKQLENIFKDYI